MLLTIRQARQKTRALFNHPLYVLYSTNIPPPAANSIPAYPFLPSPVSVSSSNVLSTSRTIELHPKDVVLSLKEWFMSRKNPVFDRIFEILKTQDDITADISLSRFNLRLSEALVLDVLNYEKNKDVLSCLKFFDWAGRQLGFHHTRATFNAIFKILSKAKLMSLMVEFLDKYMKQRYFHKARFYNTLVIGYAVAGKPELALQLFGRMRFQGVDLDAFAYHVLLNALVEDGFYDAFEMVLKQIKFRGFEDSITHAIFVKSLCQQTELDRAEEYLRGLLRNGGVGLSGIVVANLVDALCKSKQFMRAASLVRDFRESGLVPMEQAYSVWIKDLAQAGELSEAVEFLKGKKLFDGYVPDVFRYNSLVCRLLRENRLEQVYDLLMDMKDQDIVPDDVTMNVTLCFFCKVGMADIALELYDSRAEFGLSVSSMTYNYLINTLLGDASVDGAYFVLKNAIEQGYFPGRRTFSIIADALCREGKLDRVKELVLAALDRNCMPSDSTYNKFISALCRASRVEDGYLVHGELSRLDRVTNRNTYFHLISGFNKSSRGDIAARLLIEMQEKGHSPDRRLYRAVICCLCQMEDPEKLFYSLLEVQLSRHEPSCLIYNYFIDGAGHAGKAELARDVYEMMKRNGITPNLQSDILILQSYLKAGKIADALNYFRDLSNRSSLGRKLWNTMIVGLCKANKPENAWNMFWEMRSTVLRPSMECYEELVKLLCSQRDYYKAILLVEDLMQVGRQMSSFIGNVLLLHSLQTPRVFSAWMHSRDLRNMKDHSLALGELIKTFSGGSNLDGDILEMEELIRQCFPLDVYTYNLLLRKLTISEMDLACKYFDRLCKKGYEPNRWTYDTLVHGFLKVGRSSEARKWMEEMFSKGFDLTEATKTFV
ncbi:pentatricopeptide repeat-containing protein At1g71210, mitochondrial-like [Nicotiana tabacum]|uniref:Pentatricopeptide repeat-containing protein At1g71210-like n=2 Tax=Nicotiana TaxID=4085 RepID=A0A1S3YRE5_TOBAC|nr:PREDICTED: pentatricopeptide repeat-containing protein At1g71210 [Nicotiana sylvestris]XP_009788311.1 PREDICTED: pentatricopeptide repeat-containing protein At1g71210 [Nicotiana sylvestris]XP_016454632.1 PREDICTED: pentatricopeptide repeat-containing protein At1g71210-like [Nicotiana tabacum]XP_016454633.1 PREDICTED: pentatricopeptide repeat-containing protein At1g71210-like [Nicotiana tabacum]